MRGTKSLGIFVILFFLPILAHAQWTRLPAKPTLDEAIHGGDPLSFFTVDLAQIEPDLRPKPKPKPKEVLGWYWDTASPNGTSPPVYIGPYATLADCRDMLGSAQNAHGFSCHNGWTAAGCAIVNTVDSTGKKTPILGFGYPTGYILGPNSPKLVSDDCHQAPVAGGLPNGWYFLDFPEDGSVKVQKCSDLGRIIQANRLKPKSHRIGYYYNKACPGAPCFTPYKSTACN